MLRFIALQEIHQSGAGNRSGECRPRENAFGRPDAEVSEQPNPHNPRKQRKNPATAGSGERLSDGKWRRERDCGRTFSEPDQAARYTRQKRVYGHVSQFGEQTDRGNETHDQKKMTASYVRTKRTPTLPVSPRPGQNHLRS